MKYIIALIISLASTAALATERAVPNPPAPPQTIAPNASAEANATGGTATGAVQNTTRAFGLGMSASANPSTCAVSIGSGLGFWTIDHCEAESLATTARKLGAPPEVAMEILCSVDRVQEAMARRGVKCGPERRW